MLKITAHLASPLIFQGHMTFDAILGAVLFEGCGDVAAAHLAIPIHCVDDLYHASSVVIEPQDHGSVSFAGSLRAQHDLHPDLLLKSRDGTKVHRAMGYKRRRDFGNVLSSYKTVTTPTAHWYCTGDEDRIARLLPRLRFIGKKRAQGFGEVSGWEIENSELGGLIDAEGNPLRPIPVNRFNGRSDLFAVDAAWKPAYWQPAHRAACFAPRQH